MQKSGDTPIIYDFHSKSLYDAAFARRNQASDHNFKGIPAEIVGTSQYESLQCVDVKASVNDLYVERDNLVLESITLKKVFVSLPNTGGFKWKQPVSIGDPVRLSWSHRDLGDYLDGDGSAVDININEVAELEDCWVTLDGGTRKNHTNPSKDNLIIEGPETTITITPAGKLTIVTSGTSSITSSGHTIDAPTTTCTGDLVVEGSTSISEDLNVTGTSTLGVLTTEGSAVIGHDHNGEVTPMS